MLDDDRKTSPSSPSVTGVRRGLPERLADVREL
jgi:hypothetical protein